VGVLSGEGLGGERDQEDRSEEDRKSVLSQERPHCPAATTNAASTPAAMTTQYTTKTVRTRKTVPRPGGG
jgi:hypothetical protein